MELSDFEINPAVILGNSPAESPPADNDSRTLDEACRARLELCRHWKYMSPDVTRHFTLSQRIERAEMLKIIKECENILGFSF
jgi:hypothetical protein